MIIIVVIIMCFDNSIGDPVVALVLSAEPSGRCVRRGRRFFAEASLRYGCHV